MLRRLLLPRAIVLVALAATGCSDLLESGPDVNVRAEANMADNVISLAIANDGSDTVLYQERNSRLERRDADGEWVDTTAGIPQLDYLPAPVPIAPDEVHTVETEIDVGHDQLAPGEYRYRLDLRDEDGDLLPEGARISNTFRVDP